MDDHRLHAKVRRLEAPGILRMKDRARLTSFATEHVGHSYVTRYRWCKINTNVFMWLLAKRNPLGKKLHMYKLQRVYNQNSVNTHKSQARFINNKKKKSVYRNKIGKGPLDLLYIVHNYILSIIRIVYFCNEGCFKRCRSYRIDWFVSFIFLLCM